MRSKAGGVRCALASPRDLALQSTSSELGHRPRQLRTLNPGSASDEREMRYSNEAFASSPPVRTVNGLKGGDDVKWLGGIVVIGMASVVAP